MLDEPLWLTPEQIVSINQAQVAETGEPFAVRDQGLLEGACRHPQTKWYYGGEADIVRLAASLAVRLAQNHPFQQGNKRTGWVAALMFIEMNGYEWRMPDTEEQSIWLEAAIRCQLTVDELAELMRPYVYEADPEISLQSD